MECLRAWLRRGRTTTPLDMIIQRKSVAVRRRVVTSRESVFIARLRAAWRFKFAADLTPSRPYSGERVGVRGHSRERRTSTNCPSPYPSPCVQGRGDQKHLQCLPFLSSPESACPPRSEIPR